MRAASSTPAEAQLVLKTSGCLVQRRRVADGLRGRLLFARAKEDFVDVFVNLFQEHGGKQRIDTLQHAFPQGLIAANEVEYEYSWSSGTQAEKKQT